MSEHNEHLTPLGKVPDWVDDQFEKIKKAQDLMVQLAKKDAHDAVSQVKSGKYFDAAKSAYKAYADVSSSLALAAVTPAVKFVFQTDSLDTLRLGDSYYKRTGGTIAMDALRLINVLPLVGEVGGAGKSVVLKVLRPTGEAMGAPAAGDIAHLLWMAEGKTCFFTSAMEALRRTGRLLISLEELCTFCGADLEALKKLGTAFTGDIKAGIPHLEKFLNFLRKLGVEYHEIFSKAYTPAWYESVVKSNPNGVVLVTISYVNDGKQYAHTLLGQLGPEGKVLFFETQAGVSGTAYEGLTGLLKAYPMLQGPAHQAIFIPHLMATSGADSLIGNLFFMVLPLVGVGAGAAQGLLGPPKTSGVGDRGPAS